MKRLLSGLLTIFALSPLIFSCAGKNSGKDQRATNLFSVKDGHIVIEQESKFSHRLKLVPVRPAPAEKRNLRTVGQMLALANPSGGLESDQISWVELDPELSRSAGLYLKALKDVAVGYAFGMTLVPLNYEGQIRPSQKVEVARYGLKKTSTHGTVFDVRRTNGEQGQLQVVFELREGQDWYPGTSCEIDFSFIKSRPYQIPPTALLHEGLQEYVIKEMAPGEYAPEEVIVSGETADSVYVLGALSSESRIVGQGAILLKPLLRQALMEKKERLHAP